MMLVTVREGRTTLEVRLLLAATGADEGSSAAGGAILPALMARSLAAAESGDLLG